MSKNRCTICGSTNLYYDTDRVCDLCRGLAISFTTKRRWLWPIKINGIEKSIIRCKEKLKKK